MVPRSENPSSVPTGCSSNSAIFFIERRKIMTFSEAPSLLGVTSRLGMNWTCDKCMSTIILNSIDFVTDSVISSKLHFPMHLIGWHKNTLWIHTAILIQNLSIKKWCQLPFISFIWLAGGSSSLSIIFSMIDFICANTKTKTINFSTENDQFSDIRPWSRQLVLLIVFW